MRFAFDLIFSGRFKVSKLTMVATYFGEMARARFVHFERKKSFILKWKKNNWIRNGIELKIYKANRNIAILATCLDQWNNFLKKPFLQLLANDYRNKRCSKMQKWPHYSYILFTCTRIETVDWRKVNAWIATAFRKKIYPSRICWIFNGVNIFAKVLYSMHVCTSVYNLSALIAGTKKQRTNRK